MYDVIPFQSVFKVLHHTCTFYSSCDGNRSVETVFTRTNVYIYIIYDDTSENYSYYRL